MPKESSAPLARRLTRNSAWNLFALGVLMLAGVISAPAYLHFLGLSKYGLFVLLNSVLAPLGLLNAGFGRGTVKYISEAVGAGKSDDIGDYLRTTLLFNIGVGVVGVVVMLGFASLLTDLVFKIGPTDRQLARAALMWTALTYLLAQASNTFASLSIALQRYKIGALAEASLSVVNVVCGIAVLWLGGDLLNLLQVRLGVGVVTLIVWLVISRRLVPGLNLSPKYHAWAFRRTFRFGAWQTAAAVGGMLASQSDKFLLGVYVSTAAVGLFNLPFLIYSTGFTMTARIADVLFPAISHMQGQGEKTRMTSLLVRSSWLLSLLMVSIQGTIFMFAPDIMRAFAGKEVAAAAAQVLRILTLTAMLSAPSVVMDQFLLGTARTQWTAASSIVTGGLTCVMSLVLIPRYGLTGAAWSDLVAILMSRPLLHFLLWRNYLEEHIGLKECFAFLYGPTVIGVTVVGSARIGYERLGVQLPWLGLAILMPAVFGLLILLMVFLDFFPRKHERRKEFGRLLAVGWHSAIAPSSNRL